MKSGLEGQNNEVGAFTEPRNPYVSMKSGLEGRNNNYFPGSLLPEFAESQ